MTRRLRSRARAISAWYAVVAPWWLLGWTVAGTYFGVSYLRTYGEGALHHFPVMWIGAFLVAGSAFYGFQRYVRAWLRFHRWFRLADAAPDDALRELDAVHPLARYLSPWTRARYHAVRARLRGPKEASRDRAPLNHEGTET